MNFGDILDQWNRQSPPSRLFHDKESDANDENTRDFAARRRRRLMRKAPDAVVDLHNMNQTEAWTVLDNFFRQGRDRGFEKLQIIHGKGSHEGSDGVLRNMTRKYIESCPFAGESGYNLGAAGGSGSTWVFIKDSSARDK